MTAQAGSSVVRPENFATGGDYITEIVQNNVDYKVHTFLTPGTYAFTPAQDMLCEYLVVAGGGGGSDTGGGGAGGYRSSVVGELSGGNAAAESPTLVQAGVAYTVVVGAGGAAGPDNGVGTNGGNSQFGGITALGGGTGGRFDQASAGAGGSGGGGGLSTAGAGTSGQGLAGGNGWGTNGSPYSGGGGGGAAAGGGAGTVSVAGNGGSGQISSIDGVGKYRAGGGSGQTWVNTGASAGGIPGNGGGGVGSKGNPRTTLPQSGYPTTGGGGGGGDSGTGGATYLPQAGGSGVVVVRYRKFPLVFSIDAASNRSYSGAPGTANLVSFPESRFSTSTSNFVFSSDFDQTNTRSISYVQNVQTPINAAGILRYTTGTTGYKYISFDSAVPSSGTYTFSYYARIFQGPTSTIGNSQIWRDLSITDRTPTGNWNPTITNEWQRFSVTSTVTNTLRFFPIHGLNILGGYVVDLCGFQLESGSTATEWVNGTRANTIFDLSSNGNNCTPVNSARASTVSGVRAFDFNGTSQYLTLNQSLIGSARGISTGDCSYTLEAWINVTDDTNLGPNVNTGGASIVGNSQFAGVGMQVFKPVEGLKVNFGARGTSNFSTASVLLTNTWYHIAAVRQRGVAPAIYVNGQLDASQTVGNLSVNAATGSMTIGYDTSATFARYFPGRIGEVRIYATGLSADQVRKNFLAERRRYGV